MTVKDFITKHPGATFDMMTPCGYVYLTPEKATALLEGQSTKGHPGDPEYAMTVTADELLPQRVDSCGFKNGVWSLFTVDGPEEAQDQELERDEILGRLREKLDRNITDYYREWFNLNPEAIIGRAEEINATRIAYNELHSGSYAYPDEKLAHLLRFDNPLEVVRDMWIREQCPPDHFNEMNHALQTVINEPELEQEYTLDESHTPVFGQDTGMRMT